MNDSFFFNERLTLDVIKTVNVSMTLLLVTFSQLKYIISQFLLRLPTVTIYITIYGMRSRLYPSTTSYNKFQNHFWIHKLLTYHTLNMS